LNASDEAFADQHAEGVVYRLERDGTDLCPGDLGHPVGGDVRVTRDGTQDSQTLGRDLNSALTKKICRIGGHRERIDQNFE
jgi:hypothetical protein